MKLRAEEEGLVGLWAYAVQGRHLLVPASPNASGAWWAWKPSKPSSPQAQNHPTRSNDRQGRIKTLLALTLLAIALSSCHQDMHDQPRYEPLEASVLFADGSIVPTSDRGGPWPGASCGPTGNSTPGWMPRGQFVSDLPTPVTRELLERGQSRFNAFCSPCHGRRGDGRGMVVQRGFKQPQSFHQTRLRDTPVGDYYDVISRGFGEMSSYAAQLSSRDRWAIVAYIRALQVSRNLSGRVSQPMKSVGSSRSWPALYLVLRRP